MKKEVVILLAEDDDGHASLITRNLRRAGIGNDIHRFPNGQELLDYLLRPAGDGGRKPQTSFLLLLDIKMPVVDGIEVLRRIKTSDALRKMPIIMLTTTDDPKEIDRCYALGCSTYVTKPVEYQAFVESIRQLGLFLLVVEMPTINGGS